MVVIGILIALQINILSEQKKIDTIENTYLTRLSQDLEDNFKSWEKIIQNEEKRYEGTKSFIKFGLNKNKDSVLSVFPYFNIIARWDDLMMNQVTFDEMKSSGKSDIISNDSIKISLLQLDQLYKKDFERNNTRKTSHDKYINDPVIDVINSLNFIVLDNSLSELHPKNYTKEELESHYRVFQSDFFELFNNQRFMNSVVASTYSYELVRGEIQDAYSKALKLKKLIDYELKNKK